MSQAVAKPVATKPPKSRFWRWSLTLLPATLLLAGLAYTGLGLEGIKSWLGFGPTQRTITIETNDRYKLAVGDPVKFRNHPIGVVTAIELDHRTEKFKITAELSVETVKDDPIYAVKDSVFWIHHLEVKLPRKVDGLDTALSKSTHIEVQRGQSTELCTEFVASPRRPVKVDVPQGALTFLIEANSAKGLRSGVTLLFKEGIEAGAVYQVTTLNGDTVQASAYVIKEYARFVTDKTRFFDSSGAQASLDWIQGVQLNVESAESLLLGTLSFDNFSGSDGEGQPIEDGKHTFPLSERPGDNVKAEANDLTIRITADEAGSLQPGAAVMFRGIQIGQVQDNVSFSEDRSKVVATAMIKGRYADLVTSTARFEDFGGARLKFDWREGFDLNAGPLHKIVVGQIVLRVGPQTPESRRVANGAIFELVSVSATDETEQLPPGIEVRLTSPQGGSLRAGAPVLYRQFPVGQILSVALANDGNSVAARLHIFEEYRPLLKDGAKFWDAGGASIEAGIFKGLRVDVDSLGSLMAGAVAFACPPHGKQVEPGYLFVLHPKADDEWLKWQPNTAIGNAGDRLGKR